MKWSFLLFSSFLCLQAIAQYPATGNKARLGWQTTGDGLVYRGAIGDTATLDPSGINNAWMLLDTANGNLYAYRAKAWRLVSGGGGGGGVTMPFDSVTFNVNETDASQRELKYSEEKGYLQYGGLDSVQIPLLPGIWYARNDTSVTIPKGTVVRATGTLGASGRIKVKHMIANGTIDAMYVLGIAMQDIAVGADGYVMTQGKIRQVNTQAYSEGAVLYADVDTLGGLTQTEPTGANLKLPIAFVVHSAPNGTLAVRVSPGTYLRDLHDVYITSPDSSASLYYNAAQGVWRDTTGAVLTSDTSVFARDFQISGTTNRLAMFTGSNTVGNSVVDVTSDTVSIRDYSNLYTTWRFHSNINKRGFIGYPSGTRFYSLVNPSLYAGFMYGDRSAGAQDQQAFTQLTAYNGGGAVSGFFSAATTLNGEDSTLYFNISGLSANANPTFPAAQMVIQKGGNVGINTTTPAYRLDVNGDVNTTGMYKKSGTDIISGTTNYIPKFTGANTIGNSGFIENGQEVYLGGTTNAFNFSRFSIYFNPVNNGFPVVADTRAYNSAQPVRGGWAFAGKYDSIGNYTAFGQIAAYKENTSNQQKNGFLQFSTISNADAFPEERMRITSAGNVGIGTASPGSYLLNLRDSIGFSGNGMYFSSTNGGTANPGGHIIGTKRGSWGTRIDFVARDAAGSLTETVMSIDGEGGGGGNVGINTSSPSRPLHVAGTTAIRIPVGNFAQRGTSDNGDIRVRTDTASMEYYSGAWRTVAPMARVPQSGLANRFSKFDANGLLDTSAVLTQANGRIGIWNSSPAAGDSVLTVTGGIRTTTSIRTGSDATINGMTVGLGASNVASNLAFGNSALASWDTAGTGTNVAIGAFALNAARGTAIFGASSNLAIGGNALRVNSNTANNVAIGADAMRFYNRTSTGAGGGNVAIGGSALYFLQASASTPVADNVAIGLLSMAYGINSDANVAIGSNAMTRAQGNQNVAIGNAALASSADGGTNYRAGITRNTSIGSGAMQFVSSNSIANTAIGFGALQRSGFGGDSCVYIGAFSNSSDTSADNEIVIGATAVGNGSNTTTIGNSRTTNTIIPAGSFTVDVMRRKAPVTVTDTFHTVANSTSWLICNRSAGSVTLTLPNAASWAGREIMIKTIQPQAVISASSNVVPIDGVATGTAILPATDGAWCTLVSDGTNWIIMQRGS